MKRAVRAFAWDRCGAEDCTEVGCHVDHVVARCNGGTNEFENLQVLCEADHHAKTKVDAPWTVGGIYGKVRSKSHCRCCLMIRVKRALRLAGHKHTEHQ